jgi:RNA polymerase sigma factor (TIGR02999 family)
VSEVTRILVEIEQGKAQAAAELLPLVYQELRKLAVQKLAHEAPGQTLEATGLVHEAYVRLVGPDAAGPHDRHWQGQGHFFAAAAEAMRRILVENARRKRRLRHGGGRSRLDLEHVDLAAPGQAEELLALDEALDRLAAEEPAVADVVKLRYFAGLTLEQVARTLNLSLRTVNRHWAYAKAWLFDQLRRADESGES